MSAGVNYSHNIHQEWDKISESIKHQMVSRSYRAANQLRNASQLVLRGQRSGRQYIVPGTGRMRYYKRDSKDGKHKAGTASITYRRYTASAPGEPPAVRTGAFRMSWMPKTYVRAAGGLYAVGSSVESTQRTDNGKYLLGEILEDGTGKMAPRPHHQEIQKKALPSIMSIYSEPYV